MSKFYDLSNQEAVHMYSYFVTSADMLLPNDLYGRIPTSEKELKFCEKHNLICDGKITADAIRTMSNDLTKELARRFCKIISG